MLRITLIFSLIFAAHITWAQNFVFASGDSLIKVFETDTYSWAHTKIQNLSEEPVVFKWEIITYDHPVEWEFSICDLPYCYTMGEMNGTMHPATAESEDAFLTLNIDAPNVDTGHYQIKVWDELIPESPDTLNITMIATPAFSAIEKPHQNARPSLLYNSEKQIAILKNPLNVPVSYEVYNLFGQLVHSSLIEPESEISISLNSYESGNYIVQYGNHEHSFYKEQISIP